MIILDENVTESQRVLLQSFRIHVRQIGLDVGRPGALDDEVISLLHRLQRPTLFTRDRGYYKPSLRHRGYCLVWIDLPDAEAASAIRQFLRHPTFDSELKRLGRVVHVSHTGIRVWRLHAEAEQFVAWAS